MKRSSPVWREESLCRISTSLHGGAAILTRAAADYGLPRRQSHVMATHRSGCGRLARGGGGGRVRVSDGGRGRHGLPFGPRGAWRGGRRRRGRRGGRVEERRRRPGGGERRGR